MRAFRKVIDMVNVINFSNLPIIGDWLIIPFRKRSTATNRLQSSKNGY